ncbi:glycosyl transferase family 39 [Dyella monticola]|uniref:Glycosyl transferase family 39 n=1 Tax=Dyella monticola TaxID=1927958 RepID=A0A370WZZ6_9GAMM|nr:glycosyl transferase family 39 [Dyella monticola]RDS81676.1 glycosyl transferase family 39 [Dyella monticola]
MYRLITVLLFIAALVVTVLGFGPLFFGAPLIGIVLVAAGLACEICGWRRIVQVRRRTVANAR